MGAVRVSDNHASREAVRSAHSDRVLPDTPANRSTVPGIQHLKPAASQGLVLTRHD